jgi:hypothetical protein
MKPHANKSPEARLLLKNAILALNSEDTLFFEARNLHATVFFIPGGTGDSPVGAGNLPARFRTLSCPPEKTLLEPGGKDLVYPLNPVKKSVKSLSNFSPSPRLRVSA